jgi:hypothetical protein
MSKQMSNSRSFSFFRRNALLHFISTINISLKLWTGVLFQKPGYREGYGHPNGHLRKRRENAVISTARYSYKIIMAYMVKNQIDFSDVSYYLIAIISSQKPIIETR